MLIRPAKLAVCVLAGLFAAAACGGSTGGSPGGAAGAGGGGGGHCSDCPAYVIHPNDACSHNGDCCSYAGVCPLIYACVQGEWIQQPSSNCGYAVPCGDKGLGCFATKQSCLAEPSPSGTTYSCVDVIDGGVPDAAADAALPACGCLSAAPNIGEACDCTGACGYLTCPAGEMDTIDCVDGKWTLTDVAWDYLCGDAG